MVVIIKKNLIIKNFDHLIIKCDFNEYKNQHYHHLTKDDETKRLIKVHLGSEM